MPTPRLSVVIPTRERAGTLQHCLRTVLTQSHEDFEVVVSDNFSSPATKEVVLGFASPRIRYVRAEKSLCMRDNYELAVSHANGEYVIFIGDDDGLLPGSLRALDAWAVELKAKVITWPRIEYTWPGVPVVTPDRLRIPLNIPFQRLGCQRVVRSVLRGRHFECLPMIYHGMIHRDLIEELKRRTGRFFGGWSPDVYSGFAIAQLVRSYPRLGNPMTLAGTSSASVGLATMSLGLHAPAIKEFTTLAEAAGGASWPQALPFLPVEAPHVAETFYHAQRNFSLGDGMAGLNRRDIIRRSMRVLWANSEEEWRGHIAEIRRSLSDSPRLLRWFERAYPDADASSKRKRIRKIPRGYMNGVLTLDASQFGVTNVFGAAELCDKLLGLRDIPARWPEKDKLIYRIRSALSLLLRGF